MKAKVPQLNPCYNVFTGPDSALNRLDPTLHSPTSLVELCDPSINPYPRSIRAFAKVMGETATGSLKLCPTMEWFKEAERFGWFFGVDEVVIVSSGNAGVNAAILALRFGLKRARVFMPSTAALEKQQLVAFYGGTVVIVYEEPGHTARDAARIYVAQHPGCLLYDQYADPRNWLGHYNHTITQIWQQLAILGLSDPDAILIPAGTTGCLMAAKEFCRKHGLDTTIIAVLAEEGEQIFAVRPESRLGAEHIGFTTWHVDVQKIKVKSCDARCDTVALARSEGIGCGMSGGATITALRHVIHSIMEPEESCGLVLPHKNSPAPYLVVAVLGDNIDAYLGSFEELLSTSLSPAL